MENVKENGTAEKTAEEKGFSNREAMSLNQAIVDITNSTPNMPGRIVYALTKTKTHLTRAIEIIEKTRVKVLEEYVKKDSKGQLVLTEPTDEEIAQGARPQYVYKSKKGEAQAKEAFDELLDQPADVNLHKIALHDFESLTINTQRVNFLDLFIEHMIYVADMMPMPQMQPQ
ncbi:MAG: hypothetical protein ACXADH_02630 [Candidatus Kariarchaeaceae archaeon]|jgi:hypothetical protein